MAKAVRARLHAQHLNRHPTERESIRQLLPRFLDHRPQNGEQQYIPVLETKKGQLVSTEVSTIFQDAQGGLWVGTFNRGLLYHHPAMHKLLNVSRTSFPVSPEEDVTVEAFAEDDDHHIYLKSHSKIYQLTTDKEGARILVPVSASSISTETARALNRGSGNQSYRNQSYTALCTDSRGWTWAGTADGLELFTDNGQTPDHTASPRVFYRENGLSNNFVQAIIEDKNNNIWVTTSNGISRIHVHPENQEVGFTNFNQLDGALEGEYMQGAVFESSDGTLYFGGIDGFTISAPTRNSPLRDCPTDRSSPPCVYMVRKSTREKGTETASSCPKLLLIPRR